MEQPPHVGAEERVGSQAFAPEGPSTSGGASISGTETKLFLGGLSFQTSEDDLRAYFSKFGEVEDVVVMKDRITKQPRGFGFIKFQEPEAAQAAVLQGPHQIDDRMIDCKPSVPQGQGAAGAGSRARKVFVGGLSAETTEDEFRSHFQQYGPVAEAQIMVDYNSGRSRGFGFVTFEDEESVQRVFAAGPMQQVGAKQVEVKSATPKGSGPQAQRMAAAAGGRGIGGLYGRGAGRANMYSQMLAQQSYGMPGYGYGMQGFGGFGYGVSPYAYSAMMPFGYNAFMGAQAPAFAGYGGFPAALPPSAGGFTGGRSGGRRAPTARPPAPA
ncbi:hypothetical protein DUNSADRAFT_132 [Dunaliella salina]|uniref:RRM domain-containing protein n=1 Tax=Dunaliella salina TaxID=3046 RepID=A0ABQ7GYM0_DUNSA|nr:hypothetical protein DUNSADRAFT_132 [Dunaliella salina]|eukprot:KAF5839703.1 hypothetical protein DUNSADRAFT_132 [Dunaliella salina]